jgi:hypothetical protein
LSRFSRLLLLGLVAFLAPAASAMAAADWCRDVTHAPAQPRSGQPVTITAKASAAAAVAVSYQLLEPGHYIELADPEYAKNWVDVPMKRTGPVADGLSAYTVTLPADLQKHRRLIRYRITVKPDGGAATLVWPSGEDEPANLGYFVYDGVPSWRGAINPKSPDAKLSAKGEFPPDVMRSVQPYHLIGKKQSVEAATWKDQRGGKEYKSTGTLVVDGVVYDHVRYRARGGVWRYAMGKNQWKFDLPTGVHLAARDDFGRPYAVKWGKLNLRGCISMGDYGRRGEQGLYEAVGYRLFNLAGVAAPRTHFVQLRIIDEADEAPADQYAGDFWGLYLAIENEDGRFLKSHGLPNGNLYKMANGTGELNNNGDDQPADGSDLKKFLADYNGKPQSDEWWQAHLNLPSYYSYRSILECIHHYDIADGKNYDYFRDPTTGRWQVIPWDLDLTWADHMYGNGEEPFNSRVLSKPTFRREYQNRLAELRDLLFNPEQTGQLIDETTALISGGAPPGGATFVEADRRKWDFHPIMGQLGGQAGQGKYYQASSTRDFAGMVKQMKEYVETRGKWADKTFLNDAKTPATPTARYTGEAGYPAAKLKFAADPYKGADAFAAMKWRLAEVTPVDAPRTIPPTPRAYEINAAWESAELPIFAAEVAVPADVAKPGKMYRLRVRMKDKEGRWSRWSAPVEFKAK